MKQKLNVGVVGATGLVGELFLKLMEERKFPFAQLKLFASDRSAGQTRNCGGRPFKVESLNDSSFQGLDVVFFSSGDDISKEWAPKAASAGAMVIDNSAAFRMDPEKPLVVPEVNGHQLPKPGSGGSIIANPNCSTIQLVLPLKPLLKNFGIESVHVASYQAISGAGKAAHEEFTNQMKAWINQSEPPLPEIFPHPIAMNCIPQIGGFNSEGFCSEEIKIMRETKKILEDNVLRVSAFTVRIPAWNSHSEAVWVRLKKSASREDLMKVLKSQEGIRIEDDPSKSIYPTALKVSGQNPVAVGRIHQDLDDPNTWMFWVVGDNLRKGAALNGLQIAERIFDLIPAS